MSTKSRSLQNGTSQNPITFRGCGYGQYRLDFRKLIIGNRPSNSPTNQPTRLNYCIFNNLTTITPFQVVTSLPTNIPLLIENNSSDRSDAKMDIMNTSQNLYIQNIGNNNMDIDLGTNGPNGKFTFKGIIHVPQYRTVTFHSSFEGSQYLFENNTYLEIEGNMIAQGSSATQRVFFNNTGNQGDWYFMNVWGSAKLKNCDIKNSWGGLMATSPSGEIKIENCLFENNRQSDISISNFLSARYTPLISNNVFNCSENQAASITCMNGANVDIKNNTFNNVSGSGIFLYYMSNPQVIENVLYASSNPYTEPIAGIFSYSSAGNINCNYSTNFYNGVLLDNSSPKLFNNVITNNGVGLYVTNGSTPQMTPSFDLDITLYDGGYNSIHDNLYEEIKCNNSTGLDVPLSLPVMDNGYNSIYHNGPVDCLFELGNQLLEPYNIRNNYWGVLGPEGRICPSIVNVNYEPFLLEIPPSINCYAQEEIADNSTMLPEVLLMGSANISSHNGEYIEAISKYKQFINLSNNSQFLYLPISSIYHNSVLDSIVDFYSNEIYYQSLSQQYSNETLLSRYCNSFSTASDVMQPSYTEAIDEYQDIIVNPISENERHYANINQIRTFSLMMDSLLGGYDNGNIGGYNSAISSREIDSKLNNFLNVKVSKNSQPSKKFKNNDQNDVRINAEGTKDRQLINLRKSAGLEDIRTAGLRKNEVKELVHKAILFKIYEFALLNNSTSDRPLDKVLYSQKHATTTNNPLVFKLFQNYPNPFNPISSIKYDVAKESFVSIKIYDILGREVKTLVSEIKNPGNYDVLFDGSDYASGVYIYRIEAGSFVDVKRMVLLK
ncbi:MAG: right-handed parallel beta-helix repeat-containing protein [Ignavibacteria bacterium]|nr:right-handed parallel beta-helix repeat-containing protein [Ignavibacteria bacterium]